MVISFLHIRGRQVTRIFSSVNWLYRLILLGLVCSAIAGVAVVSSKSESNTLFLTYVLLLLLLHWFRSDFNFLRIHIPNYKIICFVEYFILSLPLIAGLLYSNRLSLIAVYLISLIGLVYFIHPKKIISKSSFSLLFVPSPYFEWKSGIRKHFYPIATLWVSGILFAFHMGAGITAIFLIGLMTIGFYNYCEPVEILSAAQLNPKKIMAEKVKGLFLMSGLLFLPILIAFVLFHPNHWYIPVIEIALMTSYLFYALSIKYAFYEPQTHSSKNNVLLALGALVLTIPFLLPAVWVLSIKLYFQSLKKLNFYLDDFD